ncbi:uncharacterized protein Z518_06045 [Rhinocladiella mackenziei CBS 650.93]|uniref:CFEM domain-containing protein n=1 Tax=Rhinocladiella mackenziei CBS 650.93 TaxID=1442369 RepID=A0A0D2H438_9EURO|nr:uncharacterized protein Z518_06045 [Rhinocladiella mackenziei CBS 650.93]KIX05173.1 hypothetical protein Z518_06045 [Rhinocladiella mackenziei CBS 650.93]
MKLTLILIQLVCLRPVQAISVQDIPQCAQNCLSNSTSAQTSCSVIDIACLCSSSAYVAALSCCLYTQCSSEEQTTAIQFNKQECAAVNDTAPDFVGCSPAGLSSALASASADPVISATISTAVSTTSTSSSIDSHFSTIDGDVVPEQTIVSRGKPITATFAGRPLMTGSCTIPYFAIVTVANGQMTEFPAVGCSDERADCCPYDQGANAYITKCPRDYFTTASACCPIGYQVYYTAIGAETPCYSDPATKVLPVSTPTASGLTLITDHIFSRMYMLVPPSTGRQDIPLGGKIGIGISAVLFVGATIAVWLYIRKRTAKAVAAAARATTFPPEEPPLQMSGSSTAHEPNRPEALASSPGAAVANWPLFPTTSSPPAYDHTKGRPAPRKPSIPQELPGSTYINEHHPAFSMRDTSAEATPSSPPRTPIQSPGGNENRSPLMSAGTPRLGNQSPRFVSPLGSPRLLQS